MLVSHVALVSEDSRISLGELTKVASALQKQVTRDFGPLWGIHADLGAYATLEDVPVDYWPVIIKDDIGDPSAAGYHEDSHGQPYSLVMYDKDWTLTASHELLEMLGDPFGRRMVSGKSPVASQKGPVKFLVEVCDPCEATQFSYTVNGIVVSDFYTPHFFDPVAAPGVRYSYNNSIKQPRQVLKGGYLSWYVPATREWWQRTWFGAKASDKKLSNLKITNGNIRATIDRITQAERAKAMKVGTVTLPHTETFANRATDIRSAVRAAGRARA
jgi:hypothetical protein